MSFPLWLFGLLLAMAVVYDFVNGFQDSANIVATMIASQAMSARGALLFAAAGALAGPFVIGIAVARTVGSEVVSPQAVTLAVALAALGAATLWNLSAWWLGIPVSSSHALIGGIIGAGLSDGGAGAVQAAGVAKVAVSLVISPLAGFAAALVVMHLLLRLLRDATPHANIGLMRGQIVTAAGLALANGANDAQKTVGLIALGLLLMGYTSTFTVPWWSIALSATALACGTAVGGGRIVRTLGSRFYHVRPIHAFASQASSALVMLVASIFGGPVSSTQVVSLSIVGAGAAERRSKVRWALLAEIAVAWLLTVPVSALLAMPLHALARVLVRQGGA
ncbi:MAG: anion permease [Betaproteobacteria bacterium]